MTWLNIDAGESCERDAVLGLHPEAYASHREFLAACEAAFDTGLLEICKARMAQSLRCREELARHSPERLAQLRHWASAPEITGLQRDALAFVDQFILDPSLIPRETVAALEGALGTSGVIDFAAVIAALEASLRLSTLLDLEPAS